MNMESELDLQKLETDEKEQEEKRKTELKKLSSEKFFEDYDKLVELSRKFESREYDDIDREINELLFDSKKGLFERFYNGELKMGNLELSDNGSYGDTFKVGEYYMTPLQEKLRKLREARSEIEPFRDAIYQFIEKYNLEEYLMFSWEEKYKLKIGLFIPDRILVKIQNAYKLKMLSLTNKDLYNVF